MKSIVYRTVSALLCIVLFCAGISITAFAEQEEIQNVSLSEDGVLTWDPYEGATRYWIILGSSASAFQPEGTSANLYREALEANLPSGTYSFSLVACDDAWNNLSLTYRGTFDFVAPVGLDEVKGLCWDGKTAKWDAVEGAIGYMVYVYSGDSAVIYDYVEETSRDFSGSIGFVLGNDYSFAVMAIAESGGANGPMSAKSETIPGWFEYKDIQNVKIENGVLSWDPFEGAARYWLIMGGAWEPTGTSVDLNELLAQGGFESGTYSIDLVACLDDWTNLSKHYKGTYEYVKSEEEPAAPVYTVTVVTEGKGTATATPESGEDGTVVTLTATPGEGYRFVHWVRWEGMLSGGLEIPSAESATTAFVITGYNVTVAAVFEPLPPEESEPESESGEPEESFVESIADVSGTEEASSPEESAPAEESAPVEVSGPDESSALPEGSDPVETSAAETSDIIVPVDNPEEGGSNGTTVALIIVSVILGLVLAAGGVFAFMHFRNRKLDAKK